MTTKNQNDPTPTGDPALASASGSETHWMPFAWIQPYHMSDDYALAVWNQHSGYYELGDGDCYTPQELARVWKPKWMSWSGVEIAIAATSPNEKSSESGGRTPTNSKNENR
jgi:hypothetical protein